MKHEGFVFEVGFEPGADGKPSLICTPDDKEVVQHLKDVPKVLLLLPEGGIRVVVRTDLDAEQPEFQYLSGGAPIEDPSALNEPALTFLRELAILGVIRMWRQSTHKMHARLEHYLLTHSHGSKIVAEA